METRAPGVGKLHSKTKYLILSNNSVIHNNSNNDGLLKISIRITTQTQTVTKYFRCEQNFNDKTQKSITNILLTITHHTKKSSHIKTAQIVIFCYF